MRGEGSHWPLFLHGEGNSRAERTCSVLTNNREVPRKTHSRFDPRQTLRNSNSKINSNDHHDHEWVARAGHEARHSLCAFPLPPVISSRRQARLLGWAKLNCQYFTVQCTMEDSRLEDSRLEDHFWFLLPLWLLLTYAVNVWTHGNPLKTECSVGQAQWFSFNRAEFAISYKVIMTPVIIINCGKSSDIGWTRAEVGGKGLMRGLWFVVGEGCAPWRGSHEKLWEWTEHSWPRQYLEPDSWAQKGLGEL